MNLEEKINSFPQKPGIYYMLRDDNSITYVGKAKNLKKRVKSYFRKNKDYKIQILIGETKEIKYIITESEVEALLLECSMIKRHKPNFNVVLLDDKSYPYLKITTEDEFPKIEYTRKKNRISKYFGPYTNSRSAKKAYKLIQKLFKIRTCTNYKFRKPKPCLNYHIGLCMAPCTYKEIKPKYKKNVENAILFLKGDTLKIISHLKNKMEKASEKLEFEKAKEYRDQIRSIEDISYQHKMNVEGIKNTDIVNFAQNKDYLSIVILKIREEAIIDKEEFLIDLEDKIDTSNAKSETLIQYYYHKKDLADQIIISEKIDDLAKSALKKQNIDIKKAEEKDEINLSKMCQKNANFNLLKNTTSEKNYHLKEILNLAYEPKIIEGIDISNLGASNSVGSVVVFEDGASKKSEYRRFKIKDTDTQNDFKMVEEVVRRRYLRLKKEKKRMPDLILIDGGRGQLNSAYHALNEINLEDIPIISLAKKEEIIFTKDRDSPIILDKNSSSLKLLQNIRDEAHRFAINYHKILRKKGTYHSILDNIKGVGKKYKKRLLTEFRSIENIKKSSVDDISKKCNIPSYVAQNVVNYFKKN